MNFNDFALIPKVDYKDACDAIREKTEKTDAVVSGEMGDLIRGITSGGMTASIFVTGLSESDTVTASYGNTTKTAAWNSTTNRFEITNIYDNGMWTVTATDGTRTKKQDVLVDGAFEYEIEIEYLTWLYREGDECEGVTGGWGREGWTTSEPSWSITAVATKNDDNMYLAAPARNCYCLAATTNPIDFTGYSKIHVEIATGSDSSASEFELTTGKDFYTNKLLYQIIKQTNRGVVTVDVSGIDEFAYIAFASGGGVSTRWARIYNIWLE